jgi:2-hydroxy-6-oxonona-2,4-dienedioate hydrolase
VGYFASVLPAISREGKETNMKLKRWMKRTFADARSSSAATQIEVQEPKRKNIRIGNGILTLIVVGLLIVPIAFAWPQDRSLPQEKTAVVFDQNIRYFEAGQGAAVILLHGMGGVKESWMGNFGALAAGYHVYAIDQIGFGHSDKPLLDYKIATFVDFLYAFMQTQNIGKATLVGNSFGGWIALDFAMQHPSIVEKLVLVDSAGLPWLRPIPELNPSSLAATRTLIESVFYDKKMVSDGAVLSVFTDRMRNNDGYAIQRTVAGFATPQFEDAKLASIHVPTLVMWGRQDELIPLASGEKLRDGISGAKLVVFEQCGHVPMIEKSAEFNRALLEFLGK